MVSPLELENRRDATTRIAREHIDAEARARALKTARLRAARQARDAAAVPIEPKAVGKAKSTKRS
jgi:hypothetical protein